MDNVISIKPNSNVKQGLQNIVDAYDGEDLV